jgi:hypothetical protein
MGEAYRELLEKALHKAREGGTSLYHLLGGGSHAASAGKGRGDVAELERSVRRDLTDAARYRHETGRDLRDWLGFDVARIEQGFWEAFSEAADQTLLTLHEIRLQAEASEYHTGETVGLGTLVCDHCNERLHFAAAGRIPPCPRCGGTRFHRPVAAAPLA